MLAGADRSAPAAPPTAADLAARIPVPTRLPERYDGEPLRHLSPSSYSLWVSCPEAWRRRYIKGEKPPPSGSMFLGSRVDDALSAYHRRILEHGDRLALDQLLDLYREQWHAELEAEQDKQGIDWDEELTERAAFELGRQAVELAMAELVPHLGDPVDVQRRLEFTLAPELEWTVLCYLDLETLKERAARRAGADGRRLQGQGQPDRPGPGRLGPAGRDLPRRALARGLPGERAAVRADRQAGKRRKQMAASLVRPAARPGRCAACSPASRWPPRRSPPPTSATAPTGRGGSPTPPAGNAARASAPRGGAARAAAGSETHTASRSLKTSEKAYNLWYYLAVARDVLPSAQARSKLPQLIEEIASHPDVTVELGRQRRREVVLVSAARYDEMLERERLVEDLAWATFAQERLEHPTSPPVSWDEAQRRRSRR